MEFIPSLIIGATSAILSSSMAPDMPEAPPAPPGPSEEETKKKIKEEQAKERAQIALRKGRASTILTSPTGVETFGQMPTAKKTLLGQ